MSVGIIALAIIGLLSLLLIFFFFWDKELFPRYFLIFTAFTLAGYALFSRGFAYIGYPPVHIGEVLMFFGLLTVFFSSLWVLFFSSKVLLTLIPLIGWGLFCTLPYIGDYGLDALRDAVLYGYSVFAIMVYVCLLKYPYVNKALEHYRRFIPLALVVLPVAGIIRRVAYDALPTHPGSDVAIMHLKAGDASVHLAGIATFCLLGLYGLTAKQGRARVPYPAIFVGVFLWVFSLLMFGTTNRGGLLSIACAIVVAIPFVPVRKGIRIGVALIALLSVVTLVDVEVGAGKRTISTDQIVKNFKSIFVSDPTDASGLSGTREWRLLWWGTIIDYTVHGDYFFTGKGYGINLGVEDGFRGEDGGTRSPHNGHLSVLARSGVPGLVTWIVVHLAFATALLRGILRAKALHQRRWMLINAWILTYWTAFVVNGSFDVFFEGPQGGIWFWSLVGFGLAALELQKREQRASTNSSHVDQIQEKQEGKAVSELIPVHGA